MSAPVAVSFLVREYCRTRLKDAISGFNYQITQTAAAYGVVPFTLSDQSTPPSLVMGRYDYPGLTKIFGVEMAPVAVLSTAKADNSGRQNMRVTPSSFSGQIIISLDVYAVVSQGGGNLAPDGEAMYHAIEDALVATFNTPVSYGLMPPGVTYNNEITLEQGIVDSSGGRWLQWIPCSLHFYRVG